MNTGIHDSVLHDSVSRFHSCHPWFLGRGLRAPAVDRLAAVVESC
jgi:hypothetical protein